MEINFVIVIKLLNIKGNKKILNSARGKKFAYKLYNYSQFY